jgi:hypothetical protein
MNSDAAHAQKPPAHLHPWRCASGCGALFGYCNTETGKFQIKSKDQYYWITGADRLETVCRKCQCQNELKL